MSAASRTAMMMAAYRARASEATAPICSDPWARALAGETGFEVARRLDEVAPAMELYGALRTAYLDALVARFTGPPHAFGQVVLLGAGFDTRAARLAAPGRRFFEVDQPSSQAEKLARVRAIAGYPVDAATYVACDFEADDYVARLVAAGFDPDAPALLLWEGVTPYLTEGAVRATLRAMTGRCHPRSLIVFDFVGKRLVQARAERLPEHNLAGREQLATLGEPLRWGTNDVLPLCYEEGCRFVRVTSFDELALHFTGTYDRRRELRFQWIALAGREAPELV